MRSPVSRELYHQHKTAQTSLPSLSTTSERTVKTPNNDPSAFVKIVFGSDTNLDGVEEVVNQYRAMFDACGFQNNSQDDHGRNTEQDVGTARLKMPLSTCGRATSAAVRLTQDEACENAWRH